MKILCLVSLLVCACAYGANLDNGILPPGENVESRLVDTRLELNLVSADSAVTEDDQLLMSELGTLEKQGGRNIVTDAIENLLEGVRDVIVNGNEDLPPLDPFDIDLIGPFNYNAPGTVAAVSVRNFRVEGLRWFVVDDINFSALRLAFRVHATIPWISITGGYGANARLGFLTHGANGNFRIFAHRIEFGMDLRMGTNIFGGGHLILRELAIKIDIHDTQVQLSGMTGSPVLNGFINSLVQNVSQQTIQSQLENVSNKISEALFDVINDVLKEFTINDILGM